MDDHSVITAAKPCYQLLAVTSNSERTARLDKSPQHPGTDIPGTHIPTATSRVILVVDIKGQKGRFLENLVISVLKCHKKIISNYRLKKSRVFYVYKSASNQGLNVQNFIIITFF
jgi:hypothetical protein